MVAEPANYSRLQIVLHWTVAGLVIFQFFVHDAMEDAWDAYRDGQFPEAEDLPMAWLHAGIGATILVLAVWRLILRNTRGVPPLPSAHPPALKFIARATHYLLYALIIGMPLFGASAWFFGILAAAEIHAALKNVLLVVVLLHVGGALVEHFVLRTNVLKRMLGRTA